MKQFAVIGVGNFGYYLAVRLYEKGHEVLAIDNQANRIQDIRDRVSRAVVADATDKGAIQALGLEHMDAVAISTGDDLSASIMICLNLKDLGARRILAKVISESHARIVEKIGATEVLFPEKDLAETLAVRLHSPNVLEYLPFMEDHSIIEMTPPEGFVGRQLKDLDLINQFGIQVIAIKESVPDRVNMVPTGTYTLKDSDILIVLGSNEGIEKLKKAHE
jgi:trk system potassium uptake protein TrkA